MAKSPLTLPAGGKSGPDGPDAKVKDQVKSQVKGIRTTALITPIPPVPRAPLALVRPRPPVIRLRPPVYSPTQEPAMPRPPSRAEQDTLIARIRAIDPDPRAWADLYAMTAPVLRRCLAKYTTPDDLDDLVQDTMIRIFTKLDQYIGDSSFSTWAVAVGTNIAITLLRDRKRETSVITTSIDEPAPDGETTLSDACGAPDRAIEQREAYRTIHAAIEHLTPVQRDCMRLQLEGYTMEEIAAELGISVPNIKSHLRRARIKLGEIIRPETK